MPQSSWAQAPAPHAGAGYGHMPTSHKIVLHLP